MSMKTINLELDRDGAVLVETALLAFLCKGDVLPGTRDYANIIYDEINLKLKEIENGN